MEKDKVFVTLHRIACTPIEKREIKLERKSGFAVMDQTIRLTSLTVLYPSEVMVGTELVSGPNVGARIFVRGDEFKQPWASEVLSHEDGTQFILIPWDRVIALGE